MRFEVTILGSNSATFAFGRHLTSQVVNVREHLYLVDCGEATQLRLLQMRFKMTRIQHIFISHMHGDHILGLVGLINSYALMGRKVPLHLHGSPDLEEFVMTQLRLSNSLKMPYKLHFHPTQTDSVALIYENNILEVYSIPLAHRIPAHGFLFKEKVGQRRLRREQLLQYNVPINQVNNIKNGADFVLPDTGEIIDNQVFTLPPARPRSYAFCSDTSPLESVAQAVKGADLMYHEATFLEKHAEQATKTGHSTASQAAHIAQLAQVEKLIIGHFSARYDDLNMLLHEAQAVFPNTELALEGRFFSIPYDTNDDDEPAEPIDEQDEA